MTAVLEAATATERLEQPFHAASEHPSVVGSEAPDVELEALVLKGEKLRFDVIEAVLDGGLERTIEGASTLTFKLSDPGPRHRLLNDDMWEGTVDLKLPAEPHDLWFELVKMSKSGDELELTFEDREVSWLRGYKKPLHADRENTTRAEFVLRMLREVKEGRIGYHIPELHKRQPIAAIKTKRDRPTKREKDDSRSKGLSKDDTNLTIKGARATPFQLHQVERSLDVASNLRASELAILAMLCAGIGESDFREPINSLGYGGVFQGQVATGGHYFNKDDTEAMARCFLLGGKGFQAGGAIHLAKQGVGVGRIAAQVEGSGTNDSFYSVHLREAKALLKAYGGAGGGSLGGTDGADHERTVVKRYKFTRGDGGKKENSWTCIQRLAEEVGWRAFMVKGRLYFMSEQDLFRSRPRMTISEGSEGVDTIDFDHDRGKKTAEATVTCRAGLWVAPPGSMVEVKDTGKADGRWLVKSITRDSIFNPLTTITLGKPIAEKSEAAPDTEQVGGGGGGSAGSPANPGAGRSLKHKTPKQIIDEIVLPIARKHHIPGMTPGAVEAANARHTHLGSASDHAGPPNVKWAVDMSNGTSPTPQMTALARELSEVFKINWPGHGLISSNHDGFRFQLIYKFTSAQAGNHFNHVHFGVRRGG